MIRHDPKRVRVREDRLAQARQRQRPPGRVPAKPDVHEVTRAVPGRHRVHQVRVGPDARNHHAAHVQLGLEPERQQRAVHDPVVLEAVPAAALLHQLAVRRVGAGVDTAPERHVQLLKGHREQKGADKFVQEIDGPMPARRQRFRPQPNAPREFRQLRLAQAGLVAHGAFDFARLSGLVLPCLAVSCRALPCLVLAVVSTRLRCCCPPAANALAPAQGSRPGT
mmetsp:Transcript_13723/g.38978  ORF Transcript_13723/g.38978 Transcript_13723/m.38978 type:complete len:223 (+) Transcript_13723:732-1400(+)